MTDSGRTRLAGDAGDRLKEELQKYLEARAQKAVTGMGERLGEATRNLGDPGSSLGSAFGALSKGGEALGKGKSPRRAMASMAMSHITSGVKEKVAGLFGKIGKGGGKGETKGKSVLVVEDIDVGVPVRQAYDQWTRFQQFSRFAKGVVNVEQSDETTSQWQVKVAKSNRSWKAKIGDQIPDQRITWTSEGAKGTTKGAVTFHPLGDNLTKVLLVMEYFPKGLFEKTGNMWRAQGRRARLDLKLFRKFVTLQEEPADGWRGEIRDGEVVSDAEEETGKPQDGRENEDEDEDLDEAEPADDTEDAYHEDEAEGEEEYEEDEDDDRSEGGRSEAREPYKEDIEDEGERAYEDEDEEPYEDERPGRSPSARR
ncbi:SRPBCC family protein [Streptomyces sp. NPDC093546]|uniref:SRPBCC family protein n=1 Tax=Streptomyces sp. NPDC093546 TaxID=3366040 RepID=UPI0038127722